MGQERLRHAGFEGVFDRWEEAAKLCGTYDSEKILEKCKNAILKVKNGEAAYERDSVLFDKIQYSWPLATTLLYVSNRSDGQLHVLDFGGSLGSSYFQNRIFLETIKDRSWSIVEQADFVREGNLFFQDSTLNFYDSIEVCAKDHKVNLFLASSSLPYIENSFALIDRILEYDFPFILIDRTYFIDLPKSIVSVQKVPPEIYDASYPAWFFNIDEFLSRFEKKYNLLFDFRSHLQATDAINGIPTREMGFFFEIKS